MKTFNNKIWLLAEKLYIHAYGKDGFVAFLAGIGVEIPEDLYEDFEIYSFMSSINQRFVQYMQSVPTYKYIPILEKIVFDARVMSTQSDNWNYYGDYIKKWYPELIKLLEEHTITIDTVNHKLYLQDDAEETTINTDFLAYSFNDLFIDAIRKEVNECYQGGQYLAVIILSRKIAEVLCERILESYFPKKLNGLYAEANHILWYDKNHSRYHDFGILIDNLKSRAPDFHEDKDLIEKICTEIKILKDQANSMVHRDYEVPTEDVVKSLNIHFSLNLARKAYKKYCNP